MLKWWHIWKANVETWFLKLLCTISFKGAQFYKGGGEWITWGRSTENGYVKKRERGKTPIKKKRWNCYTYYIPHTCVELQKAYGLKQLVDESHPYQASLPYFHVMGSFRLSNELYLSWNNYWHVQVICEVQIRFKCKVE